MTSDGSEASGCLEPIRLVKFRSAHLEGPMLLTIWSRMALGVLVSLAVASQARADMMGAQPGISCSTGSALMARLELLFGMSRHDAEEISDAEWQGFVDQEVTPRFPDGLTIVQAYGQWRNRTGAVAKENSRVLMIWYQPKPDSDARIEAIRDAYKARFKQESVMRVDGYSCVSF
jgi:hypothetical protein